MAGRKKPARRGAAEDIARLHCNEWGVWHWKPEKKIRPHFKGASLGRDRLAAEKEARRLNREADDWIKAGTMAAPPVRSRRHAGPLTVSQIANLWRFGGPDGKGSDDWLSKRTRSRLIFGYMLKRIEAEFGDEAANDIDRTRVLDWIEPIKRHTPGIARGLATTGRLLFGWAMDKGHIPLRTNPFAKLRVPISGKRERIWTLDDVRHFVAVCDGRIAPPPERGGDRFFRVRPSLGTMLVLCFGLVQREWDVVELGREHLHEEIRDGKPTGATRLRFRQSKSMKVGKNYQLVGGKLIDVRLPPIVAARLTAAPPPATEKAAGKLCVNEFTGRPYPVENISVLARKMIARAIACDPQRWSHLKGLTIRDGRRSGFVHLRRLGMTVEDIVNLSGHSLEEGYAIIEHYLPRTPEEADKVAALMTGEI